MSHHELLLFMIICTVVNYAIISVWFLAFVFAHDWLYRLHSRWFKMTVETFDAIHYGGMAVYKVGIMLLNLGPLIALHFV